MRPHLLLSISLSFVSITMTAPAWPTGPLEDDIRALKQTSVFALGQIGFIGHISESEQRYRRVLQNRTALEDFRRMLDDDSATDEARLYAACGIRALAANDFDTLTRTLRLSGRSVSILRTDILRREPLQYQLRMIGESGCNDAYWR